MPVVATKENPGLDTQDEDYLLMTWRGLDNTSSKSQGTPHSFVAFGDRSVQVSGVIGADAKVYIEGSNDGTNWAPLKNPFKEDIVFGPGGGLQTIIDVSRWVRPRIDGSPGSAADVFMLLRF